MTSSNQLPISNAANGDPSGHLHRSPPTFNITVRQQPLSARACGFSEKDRRVIDPPPIIVLEVSQPGASPEEISARLRSPQYVVYCSLWDPWSDEEVNMMASPSRMPQRRLIGTPVGTHFYGRDNDNIEQCFFYFADLSVRSAGTYCLKFDLLVLDSWLMMSKSNLPVLSTAKSAMFTVYNAKDFQGMRPSTDLAKCLRAQGCLIPVKKGSAKATASPRPGEVSRVSRVSSGECNENSDGEVEDGMQTLAGHVRRH